MCVTDSDGHQVILLYLIISSFKLLSAECSVMMVTGGWDGCKAKVHQALMSYLN